MDIKKLFVSNFTNLNDPETERYFRESCLWYKSQNSSLDQRSAEDYQQYINHYHRVTSLYITEEKESNRVMLFVYDTESEREKEIILDTSEKLISSTSITLLPNGDLFCFGSYPESGITSIIDKSYRVTFLPSGTLCCWSSGIYFNNNVYWFGGHHSWSDLALSKKFDLIENRWINLTQMPKADVSCHSVLFNGNIMIAGFVNRNILLYSIDIDSFSKIPFKFTEETRKILINAGRLYLIECGGSIYESEDEYNWNKISNSIIRYNNPSQVYCSYNKGGIYISTSLEGERYYKFDLYQKVMIKL